MTNGLSLDRWTDLQLEKVTSMISRKVIKGSSQVLTQIYLKSGAQIPMRTCESEQMIYVLQGRLRCFVKTKNFIVSEGEVLTLNLGTAYQLEALEDTFQIVFMVNLQA
tara:strand:- start:86 stop:409 length:324 start_codon:yes stop_codon:yes gene_type:complete